MINKAADVPKRAKNSIISHLDKLVKKYSEKSVRLISQKYFEKSSKQRKLEQEIEEKEIELAKLKKQSNK